MKYARVPASNVIAAVLVVVGLTGCAEELSDGDIASKPNGSFEIVELRIDDRQIQLRNEPKLLIDIDFGSLEVRLGCNTRYGSFTIGEDGTASFTVPGGTSDDCEDFTDQETAISEALTRVDTWSATGDQASFTGPGVVLTTEGPSSVTG